MPASPETYAIASGEPLGAGRFIQPAWKPAAGVIAAINNNLASAVYSGSDPAVNPNYPGTAPWHGTTGQADIWDGWCGHIYAPDFSRLGAIIAFGGGHNGYYGNDVYAFDLSTQLWERLNNPFYGFTNIDGWYGDPVYGEFYDTNSQPQPSQPTSSHTYDVAQYLPPALGGGPKGSLVLCCLTSMSPTGGRITHWSHRFDLDTRTWSRFGGNSLQDVGAAGGFSISCFDSKRQRYWYIGPALEGTSLKYVSFLDLQLSTPLWSLCPGVTPTVYSSVDAGTMDYSPTLDLIVACTKVDGIHRLWCFDPASPVWPPILLSVDGDTLTDMGRPAVIWHPALETFVIWDGQTRIYKLTPPASAPKTNTWTMTAMAFSGASPSLGAALGYRVFKKAFYVPKLNAIVSETTNSGSVYCWNTKGM